jgi:type III pantothenate kinase
VSSYDLFAITKVAVRDRLTQEGAENIRLVGALHDQAAIDEEPRSALVLFVIHQGESLAQSGPQPHPCRQPYHWAVRYAIDLGNSAAKAALQDGAVVRLAAPPDPRDAAAWANIAANLIEAIRNDAGGDVKAASLRVASVVPAGSEALRNMARRTNLSIEFLHPEEIPMELALSSPNQIGIDRCLAAWLAFSEFGAPSARGAIAVTLGTALTLTCVDRSGRLIGGAIAPSPLLAARALANGAAALPLVAIYDESPDLVGPIGANTADALGAGILRGARGALVALINESIEEMARRDPGAPTPAIVLSGGAALAGWCATIPADHRDAEYVLRAIAALPTAVRT